MFAPDNVAIDAAKTVGWARAGPTPEGKYLNRGSSVTSSFAPPCYAGHGTSIESGLQITVDGAAKPGTGIAGIGVYHFAATAGSMGEDDVLSGEAMSRLWRRTQTGGYNCGCLLISHIDGLRIKAIDFFTQTPTAKTSCLLLDIMPTTRHHAYYYYYYHYYYYWF